MTPPYHQRVKSLSEAEGQIPASEQGLHSLPSALADGWRRSLSKGFSPTPCIGLKPSSNPGLLVRQLKQSAMNKKERGTKILYLAHAHFLGVGGANRGDCRHFNIRALPSDPIIHRPIHICTRTGISRHSSTPC